MALAESSLTFTRLLRQNLIRTQIPSHVRLSSTAAAPAVIDDLPQSSFDTPSPSAEQAALFNPVETAKKRVKQLPGSNYKFRPPKYYRGPMHPVQPPPPTDIASREFVPGPFTYARLEETYHSTIASDLLALTYTHIAPGTPQPNGADRNRPWVGDSPYFKNRPPKGPRGSTRFLPLHRPISFSNIPELKKVVVHTHVKGAYSNSNWLQVASLVIQAISNSQVTVHKSKRNVMEWEAKKDKYTSVTATLEGEDMYHFLAKVVEIVLPRIKDYKGVAGSSGDSSGNISFGLSPEEMALFPEMEVNYDMYPPEMIPGCHITVQTSAVTDREARLLLMTMGVPFHGELKR